LPSIEQRYGCGGLGRRGVFGKSSGGYGAITHALRHSDVWSAAALSFRRYGLRSVLSARYAGGIAGPRRRRALDRALVAAARGGQEAPRRFRQSDERAGDGRQLRSRSDAVSWDQAAGHTRHLRGHRGALGELVAARSG